MPSLHILEAQTWLTAGLRRQFPEFQGEILHRNRAVDFLSLSRTAIDPTGLKLLDLEALPEESLVVLKQWIGQPVCRQVIVLAQREQLLFLREILQSECLCYIEKPISILRLGTLCRQILGRQSAIQEKS